MFPEIILANKISIVVYREYGCEISVQRFTLICSKRFMETVAATDAKIKHPI